LLGSLGYLYVWFLSRILVVHQGSKENGGIFHFQRELWGLFLKHSSSRESKWRHSKDDFLE